MGTASRTTERRARGELLAMLATGGLFLVFENLLDLKLAFLIPCVIAWTGYLALRLAKDPGLASTWGLACRRAGLLPIAGFFAAAAAGLLLWNGAKPLPRGALGIFLLYPLWAFLQQFVLQVLIALNLRILRVPRAVVVLLAALLFGAAHLPDGPLMALCAASGAVWTVFYLKYRNLPLLALSHAWLGALAFYILLGRDPWLEMFNH